VLFIFPEQRWLAERSQGYTQRFAVMWHFITNRKIRAVQAVPFFPPKAPDIWTGNSD